MLLFRGKIIERSDGEETEPQRVKDELLWESEIDLKIVIYQSTSDLYFLTIKNNEKFIFCVVLEISTTAIGNTGVGQSKLFYIV